MLFPSSKGGGSTPNNSWDVKGPEVIQTTAARQTRRRSGRSTTAGEDSETDQREGDGVPAKNLSSLCKYPTKWEEAHPYLPESPVDQSQAFCKICHTDFSVSHSVDRYAHACTPWALAVGVEPGGAVWRSRRSCYG